MPLRLQNAPHFEKDSESEGTGMRVARPTAPFQTSPATRPNRRSLPCVWWFDTVSKDRQAPADSVYTLLYLPNKIFMSPLPPAALAPGSQVNH